MRPFRTWVVLMVVTGMFATAAPAQTGRRFEILGIGGGGGMFSPIGSPHDPKLCFVSCDMGGFYVSEDGGKHWWMTNAFQMRGNTSCRPGFHPTDANVVYMPYGRGQFRVSTDRGRHWETLCVQGGWQRDRVNAVNIDRGGDGSVILVCTADGLYRSTDGGKSFTRVQDIAGSVIWAHFDQTSPGNARRVIAGVSEGVYVSTDAGATWTKKGRGVTGALSGFCAGSDPNRKTVVCYAVTAKEAFVSTDAGESFRKVFDAPDGNFRFACMAETQPDVCYITTTRGWGVYKTTDAGRSWQAVFHFLGGPKQNVKWGWLATDYTPGWGGSAIGFGVNPAHPDHVMFTNTGELFVTADGGRTWSQAMSEPAHGNWPQRDGAWTTNGLEVTTVWSYNFDPFDPNRTYICYTDIGFMRSTDRGKTWHVASKGSPWRNTFYNMQFDPDRKGVIYAAAANHHDIPGWTNNTGPRGPGGVVMSTDHGASWRPMTRGLPQGRIPCTCVLLDPRSPRDGRTLYCVMHGDGVYKSTDGGESWVKKTKGLGRPGNMNLYLVRFGPDGNLYALITAKRKDHDFDVAGGLWKSTDGAETWTELTKDVDLWWPCEFAVHPKDPKKIWISTSDVPVKSGGGLFVSTDGGETWKHQLTNRDFDPKVCSFVHVFAIAFHPKDPEVMYLSVWTHGLFRSEDGGKTWKRIEGIPSETGINRVTFDPEDPDVMYVTTFGKGVWRGPAKGY